MTRCTLIATVPRSAALRGRGTWAMRAQRCHTRASDTRPVRRQALPVSVHDTVHRPAPRGSGRCSDVIHATGGGGLCGAVRLGAGCRSVLAALRPREPPRAQGARYALGAGEGGSGGGRLAEYGRRAVTGGWSGERWARGTQNGWAARPPATRPAVRRTARERRANRRSDGEGRSAMVRSVSRSLMMFGYAGVWANVCECEPGGARRRRRSGGREGYGGCRAVETREWARSRAA